MPDSNMFVDGDELRWFNHFNWYLFVRFSFILIWFFINEKPVLKRYTCTGELHFERVWKTLRCGSAGLLLLSLSMSATCCYTVFVPVIQFIIAHVLQKYNHQYWHNSIIISSSLLCQATHFTQRESVRFQQLHCRWKKRNNHKSTRMVWSNSVL